jgi:hypothetical protein
MARLRAGMVGYYPNLLHFAAAFGLIDPSEDGVSLHARVKPPTLATIAAEEYISLSYTY